MKQVLRNIKKGTASKFVRVSTLALLLFIMVAGSAFAAVGDPAADAETVAGVTNAMETVKLTALALLAAVATIAVVLFGGIYGWRYGKKVFQIVSK